MKVIGTTNNGWNREYICTVTHSEIEKFLGLYYNKLKEIAVGESIDLGKGYDHAAEIRDAMKKTQELIQANQPVVTAILNGMNIQKIMNEQAAKPTDG